MILIVQKDCPFCKDVNKIKDDFPKMRKFIYEMETQTIYPEDNHEDRFTMDMDIPGFPALIVGKNIYAGSKYVMEYLESLKEKTGEINAKAN